VPYSYRGFKALTAEQRGAAGILIYSDPTDDGFKKGPTYPKVVADWIAMNQLTGVCDFDIEKRTMVPYRQRPLHP
jgi:hypothetical protein